MKNVVVGLESIVCEDAKCYTLEYYMLVGQEKDQPGCPVYGFEVKKKMMDTEVESVKIERYTDCEDEIKRLILMLKRNLVTPVSVHEIMQDIRSA